MRMISDCKYLLVYSSLNSFAMNRVLHKLTLCSSLGLSLSIKKMSTWLCFRMRSRVEKILKAAMMANWVTKGWISELSGARIYTVDCILKNMNQCPVAFKWMDSYMHIKWAWGILLVRSRTSLRTNCRSGRRRTSGRILPLHSAPCPGSYVTAAFYIGWRSGPKSVPELRPR